MTVPAYPVPNPAAPSRPATVTISSVLIFIVAAMQVLSAILVISISGTLAEAYRDAIELESSEAVADIGSIARITYVVMAVIYVLIAIGMTTLALLNNRGKNASRILTWVFGGLGLCCNSLSLSLTAGGLAFSGTGEGIEDARIEERVNELIPGWFNVLMTASTVLTVLGLLGAIVLLALPPSNAWFRRPAAWNPAMPFQPYPGQPAYPPLPGYPQQPGAYGQPAYPPPPSHLGSPQQYGQPGEPAPGLPTYPPAAPAQPDPWAPQPSQSSPEAPSDPWAAPQASPPSPAAPASAPPATPPVSAPPAAPPAAAPPAAAPPPAAPSPAEPPSAGDQGGDPPPRSSSGPA
ncbi:hypothetical protein AB0G04_13925 [Actinoplanes sp. NPDC023801]|uniref:hypothetical protein n=1 Tax=Actinoplanes sp. NPDC023801 TaxID=3154595 RepID=UPI0033FB0C0B